MQNSRKPVFWLKRLEEKHQALVESLVKEQDAKKNLLLKEFQNISKNVTKIDPNINILKKYKNI